MKSLDLFATIRDQFPTIANGAAYFDGPGGTQVPRRVMTAIALL
jgi:selenocysteine lyase/cysteine desulfurase